MFFFHHHFIVVNFFSAALNAAIYLRNGLRVTTVPPSTMNRVRSKRDIKQLQNSERLSVQENNETKLLLFLFFLYGGSDCQDY